jgi:uncharacterized SAM-binding protein YcdF (DUF218 family)
MSSPRAPRTWLWLVCGAVVFAAIAASVLLWGGYLLISSDPLPAHADVAVVLQGSTLGEKARVAGAMGLVRQGIVPYILLSIAPHGYWDEPTRPVATSYLERTYGADAARVYFCEVGPTTNSTEGETLYLDACIHEHGWKSVIVVTSNFHTRRAGMIWRRILYRKHSDLQFSIAGVPDPEFEPGGWWRERLYAKTWFFEFSKLIWSVFF